MICVCPADCTDFYSSCSLFPTFAKVGLFTFGEGYAMISLIGDTCIREMVSRPSG